MTYEQMRSERRNRVLLFFGGATAALVLLALLLGTRGSEEQQGYKVRTIWDNASFIIPDEDVKVAGVKVGAIESLDLTDDKAIVVLRIEDEAFTPFRADAHCQIRVQTLLGEQFVECEPSKARKTGAPLPPPLEEVGDGEHLLPIENTTTPVPVDLLNNMVRLPEQQRWRLLINEFGAGLAGNGDALRAAIRRANPAVREFGEVVKILAAQDKLLGRLVDESDRVLGPMAREREHFADFIEHSGNAAVASAEKGEDLERNFARFPAFLRELRPAANQFADFADQMQPAVDALGAQAPAINDAVERLGPFTSAAGPALTSLGEVAAQGRETLPRLEPLIEDLTRLGRPLAPGTRDLADLFKSFDERGGVEELMRLIYFYAGATNGEDLLGHYFRGFVQVTNCERRPKLVFGCESNFDPTSTPARAGRAEIRSPRGRAEVASALEQIVPEPAGDDEVTQLLDYLMAPDEPSAEPGARP